MDKWVVVQKIYSNTHPGSCINTHHDVTDLVNHGMVKGCVRYFLSNFYLPPNDSPSKTMKNVFLFHLKSSFRSRDIQICVFPSSPLFLPVSHYFSGWSKINLKVYNVTNCLNKNLITHFAWNLEKEKRYDIETLPID